MPRRALKTFFKFDWIKPDERIKNIHFIRAYYSESESARGGMSHFRVNSDFPVVCLLQHCELLHFNGGAKVVSM